MSNSIEEQEILELDRVRREAMIAGDVPTLKRLISDNLFWIHASGRVDVKASFLAGIESGKFVYQQLDCSEQRVTCYPGLRVINGVTDIKVVLAGADLSLRIRFTLVWALKGEQWEVVNWQSTSLTPAA